MNKEIGIIQYPSISCVFESKLALVKKPKPLRLPSFKKRPTLSGKMGLITPIKTKDMETRYETKKKKA